jgi:phosphate transport system ATP-binding protein
MYKIESKSLTLYYGTLRALNNVSIQIAPNTITAFIGPSGCGKSTFLRCFNRMNDLIDNVKIEGEAFLDGENIYGPDIDVVKLRHHVGMVFQKANPFPKSIFENVAFGLHIMGEKNKSLIKDKVEQALRHAVLWDEVKDNLGKSAYSLSGGQQQRLCIARTLAIEPEVILMDEPTSALDPIATAKIEELIRELKSKYTIIIVTHNMQQAMRISDKTAFFYMGDLIEYDITRVIFDDPAMEQTQHYVSGRFG